MLGVGVISVIRRTAATCRKMSATMATRISQIEASLAETGVRVTA